MKFTPEERLGRGKKEKIMKNKFEVPRSLICIVLHDCFVSESQLQSILRKLRKREEYEKAGGESFGPENI